MLTIQNIQDKYTWENFLNKNYQGFFPLFQAWQWGEVQKSLGFEVFRIGVFDKKKLVGIAQIVEVKAKRGHYLHVRQGPAIENKKHYWSYFFQELLKFGKEKGVSFIRISPLIPKEENISFPFSTIAAPIHNMDAEVCWILDVRQSEEELLKNMRKSHRYLIKKAQGMPIKITQSKSVKDLEKFLPLYKELAKKKHFVAHKGLKEELEIFSKDNLCELFLAEYEGRIICGALVDFVGDMGIYRHSASDDAYRHIPAMYILQWQIIAECKKRGKKMYNFWGIADTEQKKHPWYGLTLFKTGFGGEKKEFMHARDIILKPSYGKTFAIEYITKLKKGY